MKILHINSYFSTGKFYKNLYDKQIGHNLDIDVFVPVPKSFRNDDRDFGEYSVVSKCYNSFDRYSYFLKQYKILKEIQTKFDIYSYDIIHAHSLFTNGFIAYKLNQKFNIPYIVAIRNTDVNWFFKKLYHLRGIGLKILKNAKRVIFLSEPYKKLVINEYVPDKIKGTLEFKSHVIPNGIDDFWFKNKFRNRKQLKPKKINLLYVGDINENKNLLITIKAIKLLIKEGCYIKFTIVGKVKDNKIFNKIVKETIVNYIKPVEKEELINIYREHDIFVMPSIHETFGLVYVEAMSQGLPIIYTKNQGFDGQFTNGVVGYSVDCFNEKEIADRILMISHNYNNISDNCTRKSNLFDWNKLTQDYNNIYHNLEY